MPNTPNQGHLVAPASISVPWATADHVIQTACRRNRMHAAPELHPLQRPSAGWLVCAQQHVCFEIRSRNTNRAAISTSSSVSIVRILNVDRFSSPSSILHRQRLDEHLHSGDNAAHSLSRGLRVLSILAEHDPWTHLKMSIEVPHQLAKQNPREGRRSDVAVRGDNALDVVDHGLDASWQLAGDCIHRQQGVALVRAVPVAQIDNGIQLLLQLRRKAGVAEGHAKGNESESGFEYLACCGLLILYCNVTLLVCCVAAAADCDGMEGNVRGGRRRRFMLLL
jgi:hypothetical protein